MPALSQSSLLRYLVFGALYFAQGVPWGFIAVGYVVFLTDQGLDNTAIGSAIGLAYVPWSFKLLWGPLIDRVTSRFGRRRPFIVVAELLMGLSLLALLLVEPAEQLQAVAVLLFLHNTAASLQDVAVDALAVDLLPENERGKANSIMWAAKSAGVAIGGGAGTVLAKHLGWSALFVLLASIVWAIMLLPLLIRERPAEEPIVPAHAGVFGWSALRQSFSFATPWAGLLVAMGVPIGYALIGTVFTRTLRADLGLSEEAIGLLSGVVEPIAGVVGALIGGVLADRIGFRKAMAVAMVGIGVLLPIWAVMPPSMSAHLGVLAVWDACLNVCIYACNAASLGFFMTLSNPAIGATQFAVYMAAGNLTYSWTAPTGGWIADTYGVPVVFLVGAVVQVASIGLLPLCDPKRAEAVYRGGLVEEASARDIGVRA